MPATIEKKRYTYKDYAALPEGAPYQLIEGELVLTPSPITEHRRIVRKVLVKLSSFAEEGGLGEVFSAPYDVYLDEENVVQPDILFISKERLNIIGESNV